MDSNTNVSSSYNSLSESVILEQTDIVNIDEVAASVKPDTEIMNSIANTTANVVIQVKKKRGNPNLKPRWVKGQSGNPAGRPKGIRTVKEVMVKEFTKEDSIIIARNIIDGAKKGDDKKRADLLKLTGDLSDAPQVNIQQNTTTVSADIMALAKQLAKDRLVKTIDVTSVPVKQIENNQ